MLISICLFIIIIIKILSIPKNTFIYIYVSEISNIFNIIHFHKSNYFISVSFNYIISNYYNYYNLLLHSIITSYNVMDAYSI